MVRPNSTLRSAVPVGMLVGVLTLSACGGQLKQEDLDPQLAQLREELTSEMQAGDQKVAADANGRIDEMAARLMSLENDLQAFADEVEGKLARMEARLEVDMPVHFAFDDHALREDDKPKLDRFAQVISAHHPNVTITVEGFTDPAGPPEYNQWLGEQRAKAVREHLVNGGINADNIRAVSYGEATNRLVKPGAWGEDGWENRRVALVIEYVAGMTTMPVASRPGGN